MTYYNKVKILGLMNTGTNLIKKTLHNYYKIDEFVFNPWKHTWEIDTNVIDNECIYIIMVKDPLYWILSMMKAKYNGMYWDSNIQHGVLYDNTDNIHIYNKEYNKKRLVYHENVKTKVFDNILLTWNYFVKMYLNISNPKIIIRYEDILLNPEKVFKKIDYYIERKNKEKSSKIQLKKSKSFSDCRNLVEATKFYTNTKNRINSFEKKDIEYLQKYISKDIMKLFNYDLF